ncbi:MAG TPA: ATP-binding protein [Vicinamibacterales bacterium]|nr:ATP-binding protein [Vicinamibacterales bacterium]
MTLRRQIAITSLAVALPAAIVTWLGVDWLRDRDRRAALTRVSEALLTDTVRDACEADPVWFLAGPRTGRPSAAERRMPDAEVYLPRPSSAELPFEFFAYDQGFQPSSSAAPRFPESIRRALRGRDIGSAADTWASEWGAGIAVGQLTGWSPGPCAVVLVRLRPEPSDRTLAVGVFAALLVLGLLVAAATPARIEARVRALATAALASARQEYAEMVPVAGRDEIGALGAAFNEASSDIKRRAVDAREREDALQRHVQQTADEVTGPLHGIEERLAALAADPRLDETRRGDLRQLLLDAHAITARMSNLSAVARLRTAVDRLVREPVDLATLVESVVASRVPLARAAGVDVEAALPDTPVIWDADRDLLAQAVANVVDNAIVHNRPGGRVWLRLQPDATGAGFALRVQDDGPGVTDQAFEALRANRRFRGDEGRSGRGGRGLGLAVAREVADRFGLQLDLQRPASGGFEVVFAVR